MLLSLAAELVQVISDELAIDDVKALRLTCKDLGEILASHVLRSITIDMKRKNMDKDILKLQTLARKTCKAFQGTQELVIKSLAPRIFDPDDDDTWTVLGDYEETKPEDPPEVQLAEKEAKRYLYDALISLQSVRTVSWMPPSGEDKLWAHTAVTDALKVLPNLQTFHVTVGWCKIDVPFHLLTGLREISVSGTNPDHHGKNINNLTKMIAQSPQLVSIQIQGSYPYPPLINEAQSLHQLFRGYPTDVPPLRLRHLGLKECLVRFDEITVPHLKYLTSLNLTDILDDSNYHPSRIEPYSEELVQEQRLYGSSLGKLWGVLNKNGIRLEEITANVIVPSFVDYLTSYSGLKMLTLGTSGFQDQSSSDEMASRFYMTALSSHVESLEKLRIDADFEGLWCFGTHNLFVISKCLKLKNLDMSIISSQLIPDSAMQPNVIKLLLDSVAAPNHQLESLAILASNDEDLRNAMCGDPAMTHYAWAYKQITAKVNEYKAPVWCKRLPLLKVSSKFFMAELDESGGEQLRYRQVTTPTRTMVTCMMNP